MSRIVAWLLFAAACSVANCASSDSARRTEGNSLTARTGLFVINPQFVRAGRFKDGLAAVFAETAFGFIDKTGNFVIKPQFAWAFE